MHQIYEMYNDYTLRIVIINNMNYKIKAVLFVLMNCLSFTSSMTINKLINPALPTPLRVFIRAIFGFCFFSPLLFKYGVKVLCTKYAKLHFIRISTMTLAMGVTYFTYTNLPFSVAIAIGFTGPIFTAVLAYFMLKDKLKLSQWIAIFVGYLGVLIIVNPEGQANHAIYLAIVGNILTGMSLIFTKKLTKVDSNTTIILLGNLGIILTTFLWSILHWLGSIYAKNYIHLTWIWPSTSDLKLLLAMGFLGVLSQAFYINALKCASPSFLSPFEYSRLVIAIPIGLLLGEPLPGMHEWIGVAIIISSTAYITWKEQHNRQLIK